MSLWRKFVLKVTPEDEARWEECVASAVARERARQERLEMPPNDNAVLVRMRAREEARKFYRRPA